jgi:hypothetical protein
MLLGGCSDAPVRVGSIRYPQRTSDPGDRTEWQLLTQLALFVSSSRRIGEQNSGLLIRGSRDSPLAAHSRQTRVFHSGPYLCPSPVVAAAENPTALVEAHRTCTPYTAVHLRYICALTSSYA